MRVFVAGATGVVGQPLVRRLLAGGHEVAGTTRSAERADQLRRTGATAFVLDGLDAAAIRQAIARVEPDAIIHQMTALSARPDLKHFDDWFAKTNDLRTKGTDYLLAAAVSLGVKRFVVQSYTGWNNARVGGAVKTEEDPLDANPVACQRASLAAIRYLEKAVAGAPLAGVVLRYGNLYGPMASKETVAIICKRAFPIIGNGMGIWSWLHVEDAAAAAQAALEESAVGIYNVVDDEPAPVREWLPYLARAIGAKPPLHVPLWLGRFSAGEATVQWMTDARGASNAKAKRDLNFRPIWPTWRKGFLHLEGVSEETEP